MGCCNSCGNDPCPGTFGCPPPSTCDDPDAARGFRVRRPWVRGDTITLQFQLTEPFSGQRPNLADVGSKVWFTVKRFVSDQDVSAVFAGVLTQGVTDMGGGLVQVDVPATVTAGYFDGKEKLYYDLQAKWSGRVWTQERGLFILEPDITRATT